MKTDGRNTDRNNSSESEKDTYIKHTNYRSHRKDLRKIAMNSIFLILTVFFLYGFFNRLNFDNIALVLKGSNLLMLGASFTAYLFMNFIRTLRLRKIFATSEAASEGASANDVGGGLDPIQSENGADGNDPINKAAGIEKAEADADLYRDRASPEKTRKRVSLLRYFIINAEYNAYNHLIPYRIGEFSLLVLMKREHAGNIDPKHSLSALIYMRIFDVIISSYLLPLSYLIFRGQLKNPLFFSAVTSFFTVLATGLLLTFIFIERIHRIVLNLSERLQHPSIKRLAGWILDVSGRIKLYRNQSDHPVFALYALGIRILQIFITGMIFYSLDLRLPIYLIVLSDLIMAFIELIPASLIANFGYYETSSSFIFDLERLSIPPYSNYDISFYRHILNIFFILAYYMLGLILKMIIAGSGKGRDGEHTD